MSEKAIAIGGGVGPLAGVQLHEKIIENTLTDGTDQGHLEIYHFSRSHDIVDRTKYLIGNVSINPAEGMFRTVQAIEKASELFQKQVVLGVPCNTFHAPAIFNSFLQMLEKNNAKIKVVNMIEKVADFINQALPHIEKIGLMSTTGTRTVCVYNEILEPYGFKLVQVPENLQPELHDSIYNTNWGVKAQIPVTEKVRDNFKRYADILWQDGAQAIILGCSEIELALPEKKINGIFLIDPIVILARALIQVANKDKLKPILYLENEKG